MHHETLLIVTSGMHITTVTRHVILMQAHQGAKCVLQIHQDISCDSQKADQGLRGRLQASLHDICET